MNANKRECSRVDQIYYVIFIFRGNFVQFVSPSVQLVVPPRKEVDMGLA